MPLVGHSGGRDPETTSRIMSAVGPKDSRAELTLRRELHARGLRYRLHASDVTGRPDIVIRKYRLAVFVDGDFWHGNSWRLRGLNSLEEQFPTNTRFWVRKIRGNMRRDREVTETLTNQGWTVIRLWESQVLEDPTRAADMVERAVRDARRD